jgi:CobQ-like glutamine amidotransferase family enzyme
LAANPIGLDEYVDLTAAGGALQTAENIAARFAPVAGNPVALARNIAAQVELVAVAGAAQVLLQPIPLPLTL